MRHICGTGVDRKGLREELCKLEHKKSRISQMVKFAESENLFNSDLPPEQQQLSEQNWSPHGIYVNESSRSDQDISGAETSAHVQVNNALLRAQSCPTTAPIPTSGIASVAVLHPTSLAALMKEDWDNVKVKKPLRKAVKTHKRLSVLEKKRISTDAGCYTFAMPAVDAHEGHVENETVNEVISELEDVTDCRTAEVSGQTLTKLNRDESSAQSAHSRIGRLKNNQTKSRKRVMTKVQLPLRKVYVSVSQDTEPPDSATISRKGAKVFEPFRRVRFTRAALRQANI